MDDFIILDPTLLPTYLAPVTPRQIRQGLTQMSLRDQVEAAVTAGNQDLKDWWGFASEFQRFNPHVIEMATALSVTDQQLDELWALSAKL